MISSVNAFVSTPLPSKKTIQFKNNSNEPAVTALVPEKTSDTVLVRDSTPKTTKGKGRKPRRTALNATNSADSPINSGCARLQVYSASPRSSRRKSKQRSSREQMENEEIIQEVLNMAVVSMAGDSSKQKKRKRRSESVKRASNSPASSLQPEKEIEPKRLAFHDSNEDQTSASEIGATSQPPTPSKHASRPNGLMAISFSPRRTPVKLFKSSMPPYSRKAVSYRQSAGAKKSPGERSPKAIGDANQTATLEFKSTGQKDGAQQPENADKGTEVLHSQHESSDQDNQTWPMPMETAETDILQPEQTATTEKEAEPVEELENAEHQRNPDLSNETTREGASVEVAQMGSVSNTIETDFQKIAAAIDGLLRLATTAQAINEGLATAESSTIADDVSNNNSTSEADFTLQLEELPTPPMSSVHVSSFPVLTD